MISIELHPHGLTLHVEDMLDFIELTERISHNDDCVLSEALDAARLIGNGWNVRDASEFGFLSEAPMLTWMEEHDENGSNPKCDDIYYWSNYAIESVYDTLVSDGKIFFRKL